MNIGIDVNCLIFEKAGFGRYTYNLIKNLLLIDRKNHYFLYTSYLRHQKNRQKILDNLISQSKAKNVTVRRIPIPAAWKEFLGRTNFSYHHFIKDPLDIYFSPHFAGIFRNGPKKMVVAIHDMVFQYYPEHRGGRLSKYYFKRTKIAVENSSKIIAVSNSTKKDLLKFFPISPIKIVRIPEGVDREFRVIRNQKEILARTIQYIPPKINYLLSVGTLEPRKNLEVILRAFSLLPQTLQKKYKLVFVGGKGWRNESFQKAIRNYNLTDKVILTGFATDEDLPYIYNRASIFIYPSLYEGFGLPPLEALACGVPVICSERSSLPEVVGSAGVLIDPEDEVILASWVKKILSSQRLRDRLRARGLKQAEKFSWQKVAKETLKVFEKVSGK